MVDAAGANFILSSRSPPRLVASLARWTRWLENPTPGAAPISGVTARMKLLAGTMVFCLVGSMWWSSGISPRLSRRVADVERPVIDLAEVVPGDWDRVCVLAPYTNNEQAEHVLGFAWDVERHTDIASSDGEVVLVFIRGQSVVDYTEHDRVHGDLAQLTPPCLLRSAARLIRHDGLDGRVYLRPNP